MTRFTQVTESVLLRAGWFPGRFVDISGELHELRRRQLRPSHEVVSFFEEFSGLLLKAPLAAADGSLAVVVGVRFQAALAPEWPAGDPFDRLSDGEVFPIGMTGSGDYMYMTSLNSFLATDQEGMWCGCFGRRTDEAIEAICDGRLLRVGGYNMSLVSEDVAEVGPTGSRLAPDAFRSWCSTL